MLKESNILEFKREINDSIIKEVIAFANTSGGTILVGYEDDGTPYGLTNAKEDLEKLSNKLHDSIEPNIDFLINMRINTIDKKDIIIIEVLQGTNKPYYLKSKGMVPEGVYIRFGNTSRPSTSEIIRQMIIESTGITFEKNVSINQDLTFNYAERLFKEKGLSFGKVEMKNLGLVTDKGLYTNLGLLLSDECPYTIKMAIYPDNTKKEFLDTKETSVSSVLEQLEEAFRYIKLNNKVKAKIVGINRIEVPEYNEEVIRECLLNTIGHRNYEIPGSTLIHIFKDSIEFLSLGGLVSGLTIDDIKIGSSSSRNPKLISILHRLGYVEAYGSGIPRIMETYKLSKEKPEIIVAPNSFLIKIPKLDLDIDTLTIKNLLVTNNTITREDVERVLGIQKTSALKILNKMVEDGVLLKEDKGKSTTYKLNN